MNYIELLNQFWQTRRSKRITNLQADIYYFLLNESSSRGSGNNWENPFQCPNGLVCSSIGISEKSLIDARNVLQQLGLIEFENGQTKHKSPTYYLPDYCNKVSNSVSIRGGKRGGNSVSIRGGKQVNIIKEETKQKQKRNETSKSHSDANAPVEEKKEVEKALFFKPFVGVYSDFYEEKFSEKFLHLKRDFGHFKKIHEFLRKRAEMKKMEFTEENLKKSFRFFLERAWEKDEWIRQNFTPATLLTKFNQIANGTNTNRRQTGAGVDMQSAYEKLNRMSN